MGINISCQSPSTDCALPLGYPQSIPFTSPVSTGWDYRGTLPPNMTFEQDPDDVTKALFSGTPDVAGTYEFTISDGNEFLGMKYTVYTLDVSRDSPCSATRGLPITPIIISRSNGALPYGTNWYILNGALPYGLYFSRRDATIAGVPLVSGTFSLTIKDSFYSTVDCTIVVQEPPPE